MLRPDRLPRNAVHTVLASKELPAGVKLVWELDFRLDQGPEGAWISAKNLGERLGFTTDTIDKYRRALSRLGMHTSQPRPGGSTMSWFATLPAGCVPPFDRRLPEKENILNAIPFAKPLDEHIKQIKHGRTGDLARTRPGPGTGTPHPSDQAQEHADPPGPGTGSPDSQPAPGQEVYEGEGRGRVSPSHTVDKTVSISPGKSVEKVGEGSHEPSESERVTEAELLEKWRRKRTQPVGG